MFLKLDKFPMKKYRLALSNSILKVNKHGPMPDRKE
jgi:hypothetical protein